jgi:Glycosyltransferase family 87
MRRLRSLGWLIVLALMLAPAAAKADQGARVGAPLAPPASMTVPPPGFRTTANQAIAIAKRQPAAREALRKHPHAIIDAQVWDDWRWQIDIAAKPGERALVDVDVSPYGNIVDVWTGLPASTYFVRGNFDATMRQPWVWLVFGLLFLAPFIDPRRLRRMVHLDLVVLLSFGISYLLFERVHPEAAILAVYPPLLYFLIRMLRAGLRPRQARGRLVPFLPTAALAVGVIALFGARVALNVTSHKVMDIGYASVVGADRIDHKQQLYVDNDTHGDTYGPVNYLAYIPFEAVFPWKGVWDEVPAAHAATLAFDLFTIIGLFLLGLKFRAGPEGRRLGLAMAWAWAACPFTLFGVVENTNDGLVGLLLVVSLLVFASAPARGAVLGLAAAAKFSPAALLLLFARGRDGDGRRQWLQTVGTFAAIVLFTFAMYFPAGGLRELWNCTLGFQMSRLPDFSPWAIWPNIGWTQTLLELGGVALAAVVAFLPGRRSLTEISALSAAILIAIQLPAGHWFYFYIMWFAPLVFMAVFSAYREPVALAATGAGDQDVDGVVSGGTAPLALAS